MRRAAVLLLLSLSCSGTLDPWREDGGGDGGGGGDADGDADAAPHPCDGVGCPMGQECVDGRCVPVDPCAEVVCSTPGEVCSGGVCVAGEGDLDGDGVRARDDCNDLDPSVHPGAPEACNGVDDDCDGEVDEGYDEDGDGYTPCGGATGEGADCDDLDPVVNPAADEVCNGADDDCDGEVDEGQAARACAAACGSGVEQCLGGSWVCDAPSTGECVPGTTGIEGCGFCGTMSRDCQASCVWGSYGPCTGEGTCSAGDTRTAGCPGPCMAQVCSPTCSWSDGCTACAPGCAGVSQCGTSCPAGYHASRWYCDTGCTTGSCISAADNAARCEPTCGSGFSQCGTSCPAGYHASRWYCTTDCTSASSCISLGDNAAQCELTAGSSFGQCGTSCPSGYHVTRWYCTTDCTSASSCISLGDNAATCGRDEGASFSACGSTCPSGYVVSRRYCTTDCTSASSCVSLGDNAVTCTRI